MGLDDPGVQFDVWQEYELIQTPMCRTVTFHTHHEVNSNSVGPFDIVGFDQRVPPECHSHPGAMCEFNLCGEFDRRLSIRALTGDGWRFTIGGDVRGDTVIDWESAKYAEHFPPPTWMGYSFDVYQEYEFV